MKSRPSLSISGRGFIYAGVYTALIEQRLQALKWGYVHKGVSSSFCLCFVSSDSLIYSELASVILLLKTEVILVAQTCIMLAKVLVLIIDM